MNLHCLFVYGQINGNSSEIRLKSRMPGASGAQHYIYIYEQYGCTNHIWEMLLLGDMHCVSLQ